MRDEDRWNQIGNITLKLALQINNLIDICEGQQKIIDNLTRRIERLEGVAPKVDRKPRVSDDELDKFKDIFRGYLGWEDDDL